MYIKELKLWNFRKYGSNNDLCRAPDLVVPFNKGLNVLIGENDSGKTAILDAVKLVLKTHAYEWIKIEKEDFTKGNEKLRIELVFAGITDDEAKHFIEWLGWDDEIVKHNIVEKRPKLILIYQAELRDDKVVPSDIKAGMDDVGHLLNAEAREFLKCTYLKALRDADSELMAKKNSRLSQILQEHKLFKKSDKNTPHELETVISEANNKIKIFFEKDANEGDRKSNKEQIITPINNYLKEFISEKHLSKFDISSAEIKTILEKISLGIAEYSKLGLGTMNRLFMAAELLHLKKENYDGLKLCLIEELEAHLHPQAQMKIIEVLDSESKSDIQFILTTHSPNLASKVPIDNLIICNKNGVYPLSKGQTKLKEKDYSYLKRFLDVTKSNLFFAKGVIIVEGWAEEILIPAIANKIGCNLTKHEVSIVNVGSTAYLHFGKIFQRTGDNYMKLPVSIVTDLDVRPKKDGTFDETQQKNKQANIEKPFGDISATNITLYIAKEWTLEWCLYKSEILSEYFKLAVSKVHNKTKSFKKINSKWNVNFGNALISKLSKAKGSLDKVAVANELSELIENNKIDFALDDAYIKYLTDAIKHSCNHEN